MKEYQVIKATSVEDLAGAVEKALAAGWNVSGTLVAVVLKPMSTGMGPGSRPVVEYLQTMAR